MHLSDGAVVAGLVDVVAGLDFRSDPGWVEADAPAVLTVDLVHETVAIAGSVP
jgi:hypothetical protein